MVLSRVNVFIIDTCTVLDSEEKSESMIPVTLYY